MQQMPYTKLPILTNVLKFFFFFFFLLLLFFCFRVFFLLFFFFVFFFVFFFRFFFFLCVFFFFFFFFFFLATTFKQQRETTYLPTYALNKESNQYAHPRSQIRVFVVHMKKICILGYQNEPSKDSDQTAQMRSLIRIFAGRKCPKVRFLTWLIRDSVGMVFIEYFLDRCKEKKHLY